jgi:dihydroflavonol-4-reductase
MKVLVTGANGFLAANVVRELIRRGIQARALVRAGADLRALEGIRPELVYGMFTDPETALMALEGCDAVIHAAADTSQQHTSVEPYRKVNIEGTRTLLDAACRAGVRRFIFVSTANTIGHGTREIPGHEGLPARFPFTESGYAQSKAEAQELVLSYAREGKLHTISVNPTFMIGPYDAKPSSGRLITSMVDRKVVPVPPGGKNFVDVRDVAAGICNALEKGRSGEIYLTAGWNLSFAEFYDLLGKAAGKSYLRIRFRAPLLKVLGFLGSLVAGAGFRSGLNRINANILCTGNYYTPEKAVTELGMPQTPVEQAVADALQWFRLNGYIR